MHPLTDTPILITGGTGFLGSRLAELLATHAQARVTGAGRNLEKVSHLRTLGVDLCTMDLLDTASIQRALEGQQVVIHAAALLMADPKAANAANVTATGELVRLAAEAGVRRMVHISTVGVYDMKPLQSVTEDTPLASRHPSTYPRTKALAEEIAREMADEYGLELAIVRPSMIYGPGHGFWSVAMFKNVLRGKPVFLGDGSAHFNPVYIDDVVELIIRCAYRPEAAGEVFNASADVTTWRDFMAHYGRLCHKEPRGFPLLIARTMALLNKLPGLNLPIDDGFIEMATSSKVFPTDKARQLLDWQPTTSLEEGMRLTTDWLSKEVYQR